MGEKESSWGALGLQESVRASDGQEAAGRCFFFLKGILVQEVELRWNPNRICL